jgi:ParB family chromosome partitioning protein
METNKTTKTDLYKIDPRNIVVVDGFNSRVDFDLDALKDSIRENGVLNPVTVIKFKDDNGEEKYRLVDGERRYRSVMALLEEGVEIPRIPAICIPKMDDSELLLQQVVRNEGKPFNEYEYALACQKFLQFGFSKAEIAKKIGKNNGMITYYLNHLDRDKRVQELLKEGKISGSEVRRIYRGHEGDEKAAVDEILGASKVLETTKGKKNITLKDLDINSRTISKKASDTIRLGLEKLFEYYQKNSHNEAGEEIDINLDINDVLSDLRAGKTIDEIFSKAQIESLKAMKEAV